MSGSSQLRRKRQKIAGSPVAATRCPNPYCKFVGVSLGHHLERSHDCREYLDAVNQRLEPSVDTEPSEQPLLPWSDDDDDDTVLPPNLATMGNTNRESAAVLRRRARIIQTGFTTDHFVETKLLKLLNDRHCPHSLYGEVLAWAQDAHEREYSFFPQRRSRDAHIKYLAKWQSLQEVPPTVIQVTLPGEPALTVDVPVFDDEAYDRLCQHPDDLLSMIMTSRLTSPPKRV